METENGVSHGSRKEPGRYIHKTPKKHPHRTLDLDLFIRETKAFHVKSPQFTAPPLESSPILRRKEKKSITAGSRPRMFRSFFSCTLLFPLFLGKWVVIYLEKSCDLCGFLVVWSTSIFIFIFMCMGCMSSLKFGSSLKLVSCIGL